MAKSKDSPSTRAAEGSVPKAVVSRLSLYLRELQHLLHEGVETVRSTQLGQVLGFTDAQVRKDLAYFGQFGYPGVGYRCEELITKIRGILGTDSQWNVVLVGAGNLGRALLGYKGFARQGFRVVAAFDSDASKIGKSIKNVEVLPIEQLAEVIEERQVRLAILAVPAEVAQSVTDDLVAAGIEGIMNFAPVTVSLPGGIHKVGVDLAIELEQLAYAVVKQGEKS